MTKKYKARTILAFTVAGKRVEFTGHSEGGSYYVTGDAKLMEGMEKHSWYGKKFWVEEVRGEAENTADGASKLGGESAGAEGACAQTEDTKVESVTHFDTRGEAAAWLNDKFGVATRNLRTIADCIEVAKARGIIIEIG